MQAKYLCLVAPTLFITLGPLMVRAQDLGTAPSPPPVVVTAKTLAPSTKAIPIKQLVLLTQESQLMFHLENGNWASVPLTYNGSPNGGMYKAQFDFTKNHFHIKSYAGGIFFAYPFPPNVLFESPKEYPFLIVDGKKQTWSGPRIIASPSRKQLVPGTKVSYSFEPGGQQIRAPEDYFTYQWKITDTQFANGALVHPEPIQQGDEPTFEHTWSQTGSYVVELTVQDHRVKQNQVTESTYVLVQEVLYEAEVLGTFFDTIKPSDYMEWRAKITLIDLQQSHFAAPDQVMAEDHIIGAAPNPSESNESRRTFHLMTKQADRAFRWTATYLSDDDFEPLWQKNQCGNSYREKTIPPVFDLGTGFSVSFPCAHEGDWLITAESIPNSPADQRTPITATYRVWVTNKENVKKVQALRKFIALADEKIKGIKEGSEIPVKAAYLNRETGETRPLELFLGKSTSNPSEYVLLDLLPGIDRIVYRGNSIQNVVAAFERGNSYPIGSIRVQVLEPARLFDRVLETRGMSKFAKWSQGAGWFAIGLFVGGLVVSFIPGGQLFGIGMMVGSGLPGVAAYSLGLVDHLKKEEISVLHVTLDVLGIVTSLLGMGASLQAFKYGAQGIKSAHAMVMTTQTGRAFVLLGLATGTTAGVLISVESIDQLAKILNSNLPRGQKIQALVRTIGLLALQGLLIGLSVRGITQARSKIAKWLGAEFAATLGTDQIYLLNVLRDQALAKLSSLTNVQLQNILSVLRTHPEFVERMLVTTQGPSLFANQLDLRGRYIRLLNQVEMEWATLVQFAQQDKLDALTLLLQNWSKQMSWSAINQALKQINHSLLGQLTEAELLVLANLKPAFMQGLVTKLAQAPIGGLPHLESLLKEYSLRQRLTRVLSESLVNALDSKQVLFFESASEASLNRLQGLGEKEFARAVKLWQVDVRKAEALLQSAEGRFVLETPFIVRAGGMFEFYSCLRLDLAALLKLSTANRLKWVLEAAKNMEALYGDKLSGRFFRRMTITTLAEAAEKFGFLPQEIVDKELFKKLLERLPAGMVQKHEELFKSWFQVLEELEGGHSVARHGPEVTDAMHARRINTGFVFDPRKPTSLTWSPTDSSTQFTSYEVMLQARREGWAALRATNNLMTPPSPSPSSPPVSYTLVVQHKAPIGRGLVGTGPTTTISFGNNSKTAFTQTAAVDGLTRSRIRIKWNSNANSGKGGWDLTQFFPIAEDWDQAAQTYRFVPPPNEFYVVP